MAKNLTVFLVFVAVVNIGRSMDLLRTKRQSNDNANADDNLKDRNGVILVPDGQYPGSFYPYPYPGQNARPTTTTTTERSTENPVPDFQSCMRNCPVTSEYNPVCGTDNVRYENPSWLFCAQACGASVSMQSPAPCKKMATSAL